jgi:magnesium-transporting ATPase (P-type)
LSTTAFECKIRTDSPVVIQALRESDHKVSMLTGDALLTSLHVATEVGICDKGKPSLNLIGSTATTAKSSSKSGKTTEEDEGIDGVKGPHWVERKEDGTLMRIPLVATRKAISELYNKYDLLTTEKVGAVLYSAAKNK